MMYFTRKEFLLKVVYFCVAAALLWLGLNLPPVIGQKPVVPKITIQNATPCLIQNENWVPVKDFETGMPQSICADMTVDEADVYLTLVIYSVGVYWYSEYVTAARFKPGALVFPINPALPPGKYRAVIKYARRIFADIYFDVNEK